MKHDTYIRLFMLPMAFVTGVLMMGINMDSAHARDYTKDGKVYPGLACKPTAGRTTTKATYTRNGSVKNSSTSSMTVHCPIIRDNHSLHGIEYIEVSYSENNRRTKLSCDAESRSKTGSLLSSNKARHGSGQSNQRMIILHGPRKLKAGAYYTLSCTIPGKTHKGYSAIHSYQVIERVKGKRTKWEIIKGIWPFKGYELKRPGVTLRTSPDLKTFSMAFCQTKYGTPVFTSAGAIRNTSTRSMDIYCPLLREHVTKNGGVAKLKVPYVDTNHSKDPACSLYIYNARTHRASKFKLTKVVRRGPSYFALLGDAAIDKARSPHMSFSLHCKLPPASSKGPSWFSGIEYGDQLVGGN